jgi:succinate dehydrogenase / fumarate reductase, cytochrome b subunit
VEDLMLDNKGHPNRLGVWGWLGGGKWGFERYLYTLHRLTGLGLLLYFLLHIFVTSARAFGSEAWATSMGAVSGPPGTARGLFFTVGEFLVFAAFAFHACNGVRLALVELGFAIGNPIEPVYPYRTSVHEQRPLALGVMVLAGLIVLAGGLDFFILH